MFSCIRLVLSQIFTTMRKINTQTFRRATRNTSREINRRIVLNLIREVQPVSRADLARRMGVPRSMMTAIVGELIEDGLIAEGETVRTARGRRPTVLHVRSQDRFAIAVDVRLTRTRVALMDFEGRRLATETIGTRSNVDELVADTTLCIKRVMQTAQVAECEGIGVVVPGMVDRRSGVVLNSPQLGWKNVSLRTLLGAATGMHVMIENAPIACALGHMWLMPDASDNFAYVAVSDGVGVGMVMNGEVVRGHFDTAGEFGHLSLNVHGEQCLCGLRGCWEAYASNSATVARYFGLNASQPDHRERLNKSGFGVMNLIALADAGDVVAQVALRETAWYVGVGVSSVIAAFNPARIIIGGEIASAWDMIGETVKSVVRERVLTDGAAATEITPAPQAETSRLLGATALLLARSFAAPKIA